MPQIEMLVTDLDGTLWELPDKIHPDVIAAWLEIERRGYPILVATARRLTSARLPLEAHGLTPPAVVLNGAQVVDLATNRHIYQQAFSPSDALAILEIFGGFDLEPIVYVADDRYDVFTGNKPSTHPDHLATLGASLTRATLSEVVISYPVLHFAILSLPDELAERLHQELSVIGSPHLANERGYGGGSSIMVTPKNHSKWNGVMAFCAEAGINPSRVMAIGDGQNDLELLESAAVAVAPADAHPLALAKAHHVVPPAKEGGWARLLDLLP